MRNRIKTCLEWYIEKAAKYKGCFHLFSVVSIVMPLLITVVNNFVISEEASACTRNIITVCSVIASLLEGHSDSVKCLAWSPDDDLLVSGSNDTKIKLWNVTEGNCIEPEEHHNGAVNCILWSKHGKIISGSDDATLRIWDYKTGRLIKPAEKHRKRVYSISFSPDERIVASAGNDARLYLWDTETGVLLQNEQSFHKEPIRGISWFRNGEAIATGSNDGTIIFRHYDVEKKRILKGYRSLPRVHTDFIYSVICAKNNKYVASGSTDFSVGFWDIEKERLAARGMEHENFVWNVNASPKIEGRYYVASTSSDGTVKTWDVTDITSEKEEKCAEIHPVTSMEVLAEVNLVGCDFSGAKFETEKLKELIRMNGGIV